MDLWLSDLKMNEKDSTIWISTNCAGAGSGLYTLNLKTDQITKYEPADGINCVHAVQPAGNKVFVGTSNLIMDKNGNYSQTLKSPKVSWVTAMLPDPGDSNRVWTLMDVGVNYFQDTLNYVKYDTSNTILEGATQEMTLEKLPGDSICLWIGTSTGLFSYTYKAKSISVGTKEIDPLAATSIYPNPGKGIFTIKTGDDLESIEIRSLTGQLVTPVLQATGTTGETTINMEGMKPGIYFITITGSHTSITRKLVLAE
jgi:hypothetical protein